MITARPIHPKTTIPTEINHLHHAFQPIYCLQSGILYGYEGLLRSPNNINPELLFSLAKQGNYIYELDMHSISKCMASFATFAKQPLDSLQLSINLFPSTITHPHFMTQLDEIMNAVVLSPSNVVLEINEAEAVEDLTQLYSILKQLKGYGFQIALDDLGKGQSSLKTALELEPDIVKLDRYFCSDLHQSLKKQRFLQWVTDYFKNEQISLVIEGIETIEEYEIAKQFGVPFGQGYYLGRPAPFIHNLER